MVSKEKVIEVTAVEILYYKLTVLCVCVCVYRSPDGDFSTFLRSLESVIQKVQAEINSLFCVRMEHKFYERKCKTS